MMLKDSDQFVGQCGVLEQDVEGRIQTEIGYLVMRRFWRRGYASEAAMACRDYGFQTLGRDSLISIINPENLPSIGVAKKIGMTLRTDTVWQDHPVNVYAISRSEWRTITGGR